MIRCSFKCLDVLSLSRKLCELAQPNGFDMLGLNDLNLFPPNSNKYRRAMRGSSEPATKISVFYGFVLLNPIEERRWALIAAENGDPVAQYNVYENFMNNDTPLDRERALLWLRKLAAAGFKDSQEKLKRVEQESGHASKEDRSDSAPARAGPVDQLFFRRASSMISFSSSCSVTHEICTYAGVSNRIDGPFAISLYAVSGPHRYFDGEQYENL